MNEGCATRATPWPRGLFLRRPGGGSRAFALAAGLALALAFALLLGFAPKAWAEAGDGKYDLRYDGRYELRYAGSQKATLSWGLELYTQPQDTAGFVVSQTKDGVNSNWRFVRDRIGTSAFESGSVDDRGMEVPSLYRWSTQGKPFSLYVNGQRVAGNATGEGVSSISVQWHGILDEYYTDADAAGEEPKKQVRGNLDLKISSHGDVEETYYRPMGGSGQVSSDWQLHSGAVDADPSPGSGLYDGGVRTIELVLYDRVEAIKPPANLHPLFPNSDEMEPPVVTLEHEDGSEYVEGTWTNRNLVLEGASTYAEWPGGYRVVLFKEDGCGVVARSGLSTTSALDGKVSVRHVINASTPVVGTLYFGGVLDADGWPLSVKSVFKNVKIDKEAPVISSIWVSGSTPAVSASDALSGVASIEGKGLGSSEWRPIDGISLAGETGTLTVRVTDHAGNTAVGTANVTNGEIVDPPSGGGDGPDVPEDSPREGDGFSAQRAA